MRTIHELICLISLAATMVSGCHRVPKSQEAVADSKTYTNPIIPKYLADPYMRFENGYYYLFATGGADDGRFIPIHRSKDLVDWEFVRGAVSNGSKTDWN